MADLYHQVKSNSSYQLLSETVQLQLQSTSNSAVYQHCFNGFYCTFLWAILRKQAEVFQSRLHKKAHTRSASNVWIKWTGSNVSFSHNSRTLGYPLKRKQFFTNCGICNCRVVVIPTTTSSSCSESNFQNFPRIQKFCKFKPTDVHLQTRTFHSLRS